MDLRIPVLICKNPDFPEDRTEIHINNLKDITAINLLSTESRDQRHKRMLEERLERRKRIKKYAERAEKELPLFIEQDEDLSE